MSGGKVLIIVGLISLLGLSTALPDSAGIVEMVNGLAYGGIPYGSVTGMVAKHPGFTNGLASPAQARHPSAFANRPVIITPNLRATRLAGQQFRPVQIYNLPGVVAPGVVGTISQIGY